VTAAFVFVCALAGSLPDDTAPAARPPCSDAQREGNVLVAAEESTASSSGWVVTVRPGLRHEWGQRIWLGVRNDTATPAAACVASISWQAQDSGRFSGRTHVCTVEAEHHLVLPGETHYVADAISPAPSAGTRIVFRVEIGLWGEHEEITSQPGPWLVVTGEWIVP
jgi:hypothetical protein